MSVGIRSPADLGAYLGSDLWTNLGTNHDRLRVGTVFPQMRALMGEPILTGTPTGMRVVSHSQPRRIDTLSADSRCIYPQEVESA